MVLDGKATAMTRMRGTSQNSAWAATITGVGSGCHRYYFDFRDSVLAVVQYPPQGSFAVGSGACAPVGPVLARDPKGTGILMDPSSSIGR